MSAVAPEPSPVAVSARAVLAEHLEAMTTMWRESVAAEPLVA